MVKLLSGNVPLLLLVFAIFLVSQLSFAGGDWQGLDGGPGRSSGGGGGGGKVLDYWRPPTRTPSGGGGGITFPNIQITPPPTWPRFNDDSSRNRRSDGYRDYDNRDYRNSNSNNYVRPVQPTIRPQPAPPVVKSNPKPPEKLVSTRSNAKADFALLEPIDAESHRLLQELAHDHAQQSVDNLEEQLGPVAEDPDVADKLAELRNKIDAGEVITDEDMRQLDELINAVDQTKFPPPAGLDPQQLHGLFEDVVFKSKDNAEIQHDAFPPDGMIAGFPTGDVLMMPGLPQDEMMLLPGGDMLVGTGGAGEFGYAEQDARELLDINLGVGEPEPDSDANLAKRVKSGTFLMNPSETGAAINYIVADNSYAMQPGFTQVLPEGQTWVVRFDRGAGKGEAKYTLSEGSYAFGESGGGWELFRQSFSVSIDNRDNGNPFYVNIDNTQEEVPAGGTREFNSEYPILVRFDRGNGGEPAQKRIVKKGSHLVLAVNPSDGMWELYPESNFAGVARKSDKKASSLQQALLREKMRLSRPRGAE